MEPNEASPVVRLLDFTTNFGNVRGIADTSRNFQMPEPKQTQFQSMASAQSQPVRECESSESKVRSRPAAVPKPAMQNTLPPIREKTSNGKNNNTPKKKKNCNCKHSRCLKLYCECFLAQVYCDGCNCTNCFNKGDNEDERNESISSILERNPQAFLPKIAKSPSANANGIQVEHKRGCKCKKSTCLKRYCECFQANVFCSYKCNCVGCKNSEESEERKSLFSERPANSFMTQRANAATVAPANTNNIRNEAVVSGASHNAHLPQFRKVNRMVSHASCSLPSFRARRTPATYRSPLAGILQVRHVNDFCTLLIELTTKATSTLSEAKRMNGAVMDIDMNEPLASTQEQGTDNAAMDFCERQGIKNSEDSNHMPQDARPLSPGTLALTCNGRDTNLSTSDAHDSNSRLELINTTSEDRFDMVYTEQERLVLKTFLSLLNRLITCSSIEESKAEHERS